jgi:hypothetical protein
VESDLTADEDSHLQRRLARRDGIQQHNEPITEADQDPTVEICRNFDFGIPQGELSMAGIGVGENHPGWPEEPW